MIIGLWYLSGIISIILIYLLDYFFYKRDINFLVCHIVPTLRLSLFGPLVLVICICQHVSYLTEKYQFISIVEIIQKRKENE